MPRRFVVRVGIDPAQAHGNVTAGIPLIREARFALRFLLDRLEGATPNHDPAWIARAPRPLPIWPSSGVRSAAVRTHARPDCFPCC